MDLRRFSLFPRRLGQDVRLWPMLALLAVVVVVAIGCVLWFMREAVQNERMAVRETLAEAYRGQLTLLQKQATERWGWQGFASDGSAASQFAHCVNNDLADSVIVYDKGGQVLYPTVNTATRSAEANADLLALEKWTDRNSPQFKGAPARLETQVANYKTVALPSAQRRFLMHELERLDPNAQFPTLNAEELAARFLEANPSVVWDKPFRVTRQHDIWLMAYYAREVNVLVLFTSTSLRNKLASIVREVGPPKGVNIAILAPSEDDTNTSTLVTAQLAPDLPGWRLSLSLDNDALFDAEAERRVARYLVIGGGVIAAMLVLAIFMARGFGRQVQLARLKNDLVANVSHELKTPLTAMRALVDTLLDTEQLEEKTTRDYLKLLATENARLSRLIDNFLTFSRLERNKFTFEFARVNPQRIVDGAMAAMGERAHAPGCTVESRVAAAIPEINGDADALTTALLNLLDNAWKYSGDNKHITIRAEARNGCVCFAVEDNGVGLSPQEQRRVFQRFYQSDQRLARAVGGCGLGLSIVQSIVDAHHGSVRVESEVGHGSTFIFEIPTVEGSAS
jgi:signal transduction histidine kinase